MSSIQVDDADSSIQYAPGWFTAGGPGEFQETTHGTVSNGKTATFKFTGSKVAVYGTVGPKSLSGTPSSSYSIDGKVIGTFTGTANSNSQYTQAYFISPTLSDGEHTLVITNTGPSRDSTFWLDYIEYVPSSQSASTNPVAPVSNQQNQQTTPTSTPAAQKEETTPPAQSTSRTPSKSSSAATESSTDKTSSSPGSSTTSTLVIVYSTVPGGAVVASTITQSITVPTTGSQESRRSSAIGVIVGGVVGGVVVLVLILLLLVFWFRRRRRNDEEDVQSEHGHILPFDGSSVPAEYTSVVGRTGGKHARARSGQESDSDLPPAYEPTPSTSSVTTGKRS